jgi:hypothetical protein
VLTSLYSCLPHALDQVELYRYIPPFVPCYDGCHVDHLGGEYRLIAEALAEGRGFSDPFGAGPGLHRGDVVVFDDLTSHLSPAVFEAIGRAGASVLPLPPYSPDYTPIEEMFSKFKEFLRRVGARARDHLYDAIGEGLRQVTPQDILGWFRHAGLCTIQT